MLIIDSILHISFIILIQLEKVLSHSPKDNSAGSFHENNLYAFENFIFKMKATFLIMLMELMPSGVVWVLENLDIDWYLMSTYR